MRLIRVIIRLLVPLVAVLLVSCIDGREEIWLNADGSGRADISYSLPAAAARFQGGPAGVGRMLDRFLKSSPAITSSSHEVTLENDRLKIRVRASFTSATELKKISSQESLDLLPSSATDLAGKVKMSISGRTVDFSRTVSPGRALPGAAFMPASSFEGMNLVYIVHLPEVAIESNAKRIEDGGRTLIWEFPLHDAIRHPVTTRFKVKVPIPAWMIASAAGGLLLVVTLSAIGIRRLRRNRAAGSAP